MAGLGNRRKTCQTTMLIDWFLRAGETANESVVSPETGDCALPTNTVGVL